VASDDKLVRELMEKLGRLEEDREHLTKRYAEVEAENKDFASRYVQIESENNSLLSIYVASYQLHSTLDFQEVLQIITEIILNFVGAEVFGIALVDEATGEFHPLVAEGIEKAELAKLSIKEGIIGEVIAKGEAHFVTSIENLTVKPDAPAICIPLKIKDRTIGTVLVYKFLPQKTQLLHVDHELFTLLAGHAATAIFSAKLYTDSKRKLNTIQGLIDLVTS
jgi:transcriptional regulator with GAF, ATPase, and Fis domain